MTQMQGTPGTPEYFAMSPSEQAEMDKFAKAISSGMASVREPMSVEPPPVEIEVIPHEQTPVTRVVTASGKSKVAYAPLPAPPPVEAPPPPAPTVVSKRVAARIAAKAAKKTIPAPAQPPALPKQVEPAEAVEPRKPKRLPVRSIRMPKRKRKPPCESPEGSSS